MSSVTATSVLQTGNTAVITGASSGIGRAMAFFCASKGMNVWMVDVDREELETAKQMTLEKKSGEEQKIVSRKIDVSDCKAMMDLAKEVFADGGQCNFLMNNAGVGTGGGPLTDMKTVAFTMGVNTYGPIHGCLAFVPKMKESKAPGIIVNTGSKQGCVIFSFCILLHYFSPDKRFFSLKNYHATR